MLMEFGAQTANRVPAATRCRGHASGTHRGSRPRLLAALGLLAALAGSTSGAEELPAHAPDRILVRFRPTTESAARARLHTAAGGAVPRRQFTIPADLELIELPPPLDVPAALQLYRHDPAVLYAEPDYRQELDAVPDDPRLAELWGMENTCVHTVYGCVEDSDIDAPAAWDLTTGSRDIVVMIIDTGFDYTHPDLADNIWANAAECSGQAGVDDDENGYVDDCHGIDTANDDGDPLDDHSHGTHVSGTIGAVGDNGIGVAGVSWQVGLMSCKFLLAAGYGFTSDAVGCLEYAAIMKDRGVNIVATNNSWGGGGVSEALRDAISAQLDRGILFIAAAGNQAEDGDWRPHYPAGYGLPNIVSVGATMDTDQLASFSNFGGRSVDVAAPGYSILSTIPGDDYDFYSGTSMAAPHVSGAVALLAAQDPLRTWIGLRNLLLAGADRVASLDGSVRAGGRLNAYGALTCTDTEVLARILPGGEARGFLPAVSGSLDVAMLHIRCASPAGGVSVTVQPTMRSVPLLDNGIAPDLAAGDGVYAGRVDVSGMDEATLLFPGGEVVPVFTAAPYAPRAVDYEWVEITGNKLELSGATMAEIPAQFPIPFAGASMAGLAASVFGGLTFSRYPLSPYASPIPTSSVETLIAPFWDWSSSFATSLGGGLYYEILGTAPDRKLVVEWRNKVTYPCWEDDGITFQVVIDESRWRLRYNYKDVVFGSACPAENYGGSASIGLQVNPLLGAQVGVYSPILANESSIAWRATQSVRVAVDGIAGGRVVSDGGEIDCGARCSAETDRVSMELTAIPPAGAELSEWVGACEGSRATSCTLALRTDRDVTVVFGLPVPLLGWPAAALAGVLAGALLARASRRGGRGRKDAVGRA